MSDKASAEIDAIHPAMVQWARGLGRAAPDTAAAITELLQFPLRATGAEKSLQGNGVSNYVDLSSGSAVRDFACGSRTIDGHKGIDLFLWPFPWRAMDRREAAVVAALGGTIIAKRDGDYDRQCSWSTSETGNHVVVQNDNGLTAYYWHLQKGTVTSKVIGSRVETGETLRFVGSSGKSTGPHLHFELRNLTGAVIEPARGTCNDSATRWAHQAAKIDTAILDVSTHSAPPSGGGQCKDPSRNYDDIFERSMPWGPSATSLPGPMPSSPSCGRMARRRHRGRPGARPRAYGPPPTGTWAIACRPMRRPRPSRARQRC